MKIPPKMTINPLLTPGTFILKVKGEVIKMVFLDDFTADDIPTNVDEIAVCLHDYEIFTRITKRSVQ